MTHCDCGKRLMREFIPLGSCNICSLYKGIHPKYDIDKYNEIKDIVDQKGGLRSAVKHLSGEDKKYYLAVYKLIYHSNYNINNRDKVNAYLKNRYHRDKNSKSI